MGAKKRTAIVDRQPRSMTVKTRLATNKTAISSTSTNKPKKKSTKATSKKSLPIKKRIQKKKFTNEETTNVSKHRSISNYKTINLEPCTTSSIESKLERKVFESSNESEENIKFSNKDGKTKAISKMLKSLDIQISGFANILPPEEKIIEVLKSSISENVKTKSRATAVKLNNKNAANKVSVKKEHADKKSQCFNSNSFDTQAKDVSTSKNEAFFNFVGEYMSLNENNIKKTGEDMEEPIVETKKKMAAKKAKLEANRKKKMQEDLKEENILNQTQDLSLLSRKDDISLDHILDKTEFDKKKLLKPKRSQLFTQKEFPDAGKTSDYDVTRQVKSAPHNDKEILQKYKEIQFQLKGACQTNSKHAKLVQSENEECAVKKKQLKPTKKIHQVFKESSEQCKYEKCEEINDKIKFAETLNSNESFDEKKEETQEKRKKKIKPLKSSKINFEVKKDPGITDTSVLTPKFALPKKNKLFKSKCIIDTTRSFQVLKKQGILSGTSKKTNIKESSLKFSENEDSPKKPKSFTIRQHLRHKYNMSPLVKSSSKPFKKINTKKGHTIYLAPQITNDIYDFKSGSESEENIKMELPILKKLREFSDEDDKPLQMPKNDVNLEDKKNDSMLERNILKKIIKIEKQYIKTSTKTSAAGNISTGKIGRKTQSKRKPPESSNDEKSSTPTDSEDEQKLSMFGQKRHRMASLNAAAKVQCLYENESRTAYELGLSKTVQVVPRIRYINSGSSSEDDKETKPAIKKEVAVTKEPKKVDLLKKEPVEKVEEEKQVETKRELRNVPGRGMGKHWEFESDTDNEAIFIEKLRLKKKKLQKIKTLQAKKEKDKEKNEEKLTKLKKSRKSTKKHAKVTIASDDGSSESSEYANKEKSMQHSEKPFAAEKKKRKRELKEELICDYKGILACKRMASLNASAIVAATYEVERHFDRNFASDCSSFESFPEEEKHANKKSKKQTTAQTNIVPNAIRSENSQVTTLKINAKDLKDSNSIKIDPSECSDTKDSFNDFKESVQDAIDSSRPTSSSLVIVQDTDVTITGVYVNPTTGSSQEAYCKMQYHVQSSVTGSVEPPKSYTPLGALSSMRPPGTASRIDDHSTPPTLADSVPTITESIIHSNIYQPNESSQHDSSQHSHYSYHHHMSPSSMSLHPHPTDHASHMNHCGGHQSEFSPEPPQPPQALNVHHYHSPQQRPPPSSTSLSQTRCESPVRYVSGYQAQHPTLSMTAGGGSSAFCAPPSLQQQQQQQQHPDMSEVE